MPRTHYLLRVGVALRRAQVSLEIVKRRPAFALYLLSLAAFPFKWLSPFAHAQAGLIDAFIAAAALAWAGEWARRRDPLVFRPVHLALGAYLGWACVAGAFASEPRRIAAENVLIAIELATLMLMTSDYARSDAARALMARVILLVLAVTALEAAVGVALFYAGRSNSLVNGYSSYFRSSDLYTRVSAGFYSPPLLGSFCIFASGLLAMPRTRLSKLTVRTAQLALGALVVLTISRAVIGFAVALIVRFTLRNHSGRGRQIALVTTVIGVLAIAALTVVPLSADPARPSSIASPVNPRLTMIKTSARTLSHHPLTGAGPGALTGSLYGQPSRAHLTPLNVAATTGPPSVVALTALIVLLWRRRRRPTDPAVWGALLGLAIDGLGQDVEHFRHIWLMLGIADADRAPEEVTWMISLPRRRDRQHAGESALLLF